MRVLGSRNTTYCFRPPVSTSNVAAYWFRSRVSRSFFQRTLPVRLSSAISVACVPPGTDQLFAIDQRPIAKTPVSRWRAKFAGIAYTPHDVARDGIKAEQPAVIREDVEAVAVNGGRPLGLEPRA